MLFFFVCLLPSVVANELSFVEPSSCDTNEYFDISQLTCRPCANGARRSDDGFGCACAPNAKLTSDLVNPSSISCTTCASGEASSRDGRDCVKCDPLTAPYNGETCTPCANLNTVSVDRSLDGALASESRCEACVSGTRSNGERCVSCQPLPSAQSRCQCPVQLDGSCFLFEWLIPIAETLIPDIDGIQSALFSRLFRASVARCEFVQNLTSCQVLGNLCVLTDYSRGTRRDACTEYARLQGPKSEYGNLPWLYYEENAALVLDQTTLNGRYSFGDSVDKPGSLEFVVAVYASNGSLLRYGDFIDELQLCSDRLPVLQSAFQVGTTYENECQYKVPLTGDVLFFDVFLRDGTDGKLFEVPVLNENYLDGGQAVNADPDRSAWQLVRRLFLVDSQSGVTTTGAKPRQVTVADRIEIDVRLTSNSGQIYPPLIKIHYEKISISASNPTPSVPVSFRVVYSMDTGSFNTGMSVAIGIMSAIMFLYAILQIHGWRRRAGVDTLDFTTISTFFFLFCGSLSSSFFWILVGSGVYWLLFFKLQNDVVVFLPTRDQEDIFVALLVVALVLKLLRLVHVVWKQSRVDIFLIDWEKPQRSHDDVESATRSTVSIWRTYFVANEWNELQTMRKISATFQFVVALLLLKVVGFEDVCRRNPHSDFSLARDDYPASFSRILRFGMASSLLLVVALCQWIFFAFVYERFVEDKIRQFVDLCSVANISVFLLEEPVFGYYIHGRSVHGRADTNMKEMNLQLAREVDDLCGKRGLVADTDLQTFELALTHRLRQHYDRIMLPVQEAAVSRRGQRTTDGAGGAGGGGTSSSRIDPRTLQAYGSMNKFLSAFLDHALKDHDFIVRDKILLERLLGIEFNDPMDKAYLYNDEGHHFDSTLFYGNEMTLLLADILVFAFVDMLATDFVLAAFIAYLVGLLFALLRDSLGRRNLAKKTLVDERFLI